MHSPPSVSSALLLKLSTPQYWFTEKAKQIEESSIYYACVARLMGQGGVWMVTVVRYSAIPGELAAPFSSSESKLISASEGHVITAIQSTVGMAFWLYLVAVVLSLPKAYAFVYLGVALGRVKGEATDEDKKVSRSGARSPVDSRRTARQLMSTFPWPSSATRNNPSSTGQ